MKINYSIKEKQGINWDLLKDYLIKQQYKDFGLGVDWDNNQLYWILGGANIPKEISKELCKIIFGKDIEIGEYDYFGSASIIQPLRGKLVEYFSEGHPIDELTTYTVDNITPKLLLYHIGLLTSILYNKL